MFYSVILKEDSQYLYIGNSPEKLEKQNLCFIVRGEEQNVCNYIAESVASAANNLVEKPQLKLNDWPKKGTNYVYLLDDNDKKPFYVGVGHNKRAKEHARDFRKYKRTNDKKLKTAKNIQIAEGDNKGNLDDLHRVIAPFEVNLRACAEENTMISKITAHAFEKFLITHFYGVNKLTNETKGDNRELKTLIRPSCFYNNDDTDDYKKYKKRVWGQAIDRFIDGYDLTQNDLHPLKLIDLKPFWNDFLCDLDNYLHEELRDVTRSQLGLFFNGTDFGGYITFQNSPVRIQLKGSNKAPAVVINLRRNHDYTLEEYQSKLVGIYGKHILDPNDMHRIRNPGDEYYKPFRISAKKDRDFIISDLREDSKLITTLRELIKKIK